MIHLRRRPGAHLARDASVLLLLLVLLAAVAITAGMSRPAAGSTSPPAVPLPALIGWGAVAAVAGGLMLAVGMPLWKRHEKWLAALLFALFLLGFGLLAERSHVVLQPVPAQEAQTTPQPVPPSPAPTASGQTVKPSPRVVPPGAHTGAGVPAWAIAAGGALAVLLALLVLRPPPRGATRMRPAAADALDDAVATAMLDVEGETDPRRAVIAAWMAMGEALARHGLRRRPYEAPLEYMHRALRAVHVSQPSVQRLTALFQRARYSDHPATEAMRSEALAALQSVRDDLEPVPS